MYVERSLQVKIFDRHMHTIEMRCIYTYMTSAISHILHFYLFLYLSIFLSFSSIIISFLICVSHFFLLFFFLFYFLFLSPLFMGLLPITRRLARPKCPVPTVMHGSYSIIIYVQQYQYLNTKSLLRCI